MTRSFDWFVDQLARRGSCVGGGSAAAGTAALAAALLEKLLVDPTHLRQVRQIRRECLRFVGQDARVFAGVVRALRRKQKRQLQRALKAATDLQAEVLVDARTVQHIARVTQQAVSPAFESDARCAESLARGAADSARELIRANRAWMQSPPLS